MMTPQVPLVLALHGEPDKLVSKPDTYSDLLQLARKPTIFFHQLKQFKDEQIIFRFKWDDTEVDLDDSAFEFVQARTRLRIITVARAPSIKTERRPSPPGPPVTSEPPQKRVKLEGRVEIDLTESDGAAAPTSQATAKAHDRITIKEPIHEPGGEHQPIIKHSQSIQDKNDRPHGEGQSMAGEEAATKSPTATQNQPVSHESLQTGAARQIATQSQPPKSQATAQEVQPSPPQPVAISRLSANIFAVGVTSLTRTIRPQRQLTPKQWVKCREPWLGEKDGLKLGKFSLRILTEQYIMPCFFRSKYVHLSTLKKHMQRRSYPTNRSNIEQPILRAYPDNVSFAANNITDGMDIHFYASDRPGIYFLPPKVQGTKSFVAIPELSVSLELCPGWNLTSIYPWTRIDTLDGIERAEWKVSVDKFGRTVSKSGSDEYFGHLSWKTEANTAFKPPVDKVFRFNPAKPVLNLRNSVILHRYQVLPPSAQSLEPNYLQKVLANQLGLPEDIVKDFRSCFHTKFQEQLYLGHHQNVAISFVRQEDLEEVAPINITPRPDATARIFMLFDIVDDRKYQKSWPGRVGQHDSVEDALEAKNWAEVIGIQRDLLTDDRKFRAIEWGFMRVQMEYPVRNPGWK